MITTAEERFAHWLKLYHNLTPDQVEISPTRGYWTIKEKCGGAGRCRHAIHGCLFNEKPTNHTVYYADEGRINGRFASQYRTWRELYDKEKNALSRAAND